MQVLQKFFLIAIETHAQGSIYMWLETFCQNTKKYDRGKNMLQTFFQKQNAVKKCAKGVVLIA